MAKSSQAFRTIREVADWLDVKAHVLRFWESKFPQIRPVKRAGGRRYYRPGDMELVGGIKVLLHEQGMTIKGVQDLIRDEGTVHVCALSPPIDTLDFEDAPSDEIAAWDRELAGDGVEEADIIAQAQPPAATDPEPIAELPLAEPPVASEIGAPVFPETAASMEEPRATVSETDAGQPDAEEPSREPMTAPDAMEAGLDLDTELAGIEDTPAGTTPEFMPAEPEFAFDSGQDNAPPEREEEPLLVDLDAPFSGMPEPEPQAGRASAGAGSRAARRRTRDRPEPPRTGSHSGRAGSYGYRCALGHPHGRRRHTGCHAGHCRSIGTTDDRADGGFRRIDRAHSGAFRDRARGPCAAYCAQRRSGRAAVGLIGPQARFLACTWQQNR